MDSAIKYPGGKSYLAKEIIYLMHPHIHYVEPYFGSGAVLFEKNFDGVSEVVNDIDGDLTNFWKVLQDDDSFDKFKIIIESTPFSEEEWKDTKTQVFYTTQLALWETLFEPHYRAAQFFVRCRQSRSGAGKSFATLSKNRTRRKMNEQVSAWLTAIDGLPEVHNRLKRVVIYNKCALDVIKAEDSKNTFFYLDPPYLHETRVTKNHYKYEMTYQQHEDLLQLLEHIEGKFILSGYNNDLYESYRIRNSWNRTDIDIVNHMSSSDTKRKMIECLWMNY